MKNIKMLDQILVSQQQFTLEPKKSGDTWGQRAAFPERGLGETALFPMEKAVSPRIILQPPENITRYPRMNPARSSSGRNRA